MVFAATPFEDELDAGQTDSRLASVKAQLMHQVQLLVPGSNPFCIYSVFSDQRAGPARSQCTCAMDPPVPGPSSIA